MKFIKIIVSAVLPMMCLSVAAQERSDNTPQKNNFTVAATLGYNSFTNVTALPGNLSNYEAAASTATWNDKKIMVGLEVGYFISDAWKLNLGGGLNFSHNPGYADRPGTIDEFSGDDTLGDIPNYRAVASQYNCNYDVALGLDRYFRAGNIRNLMWYTGLKVGFAYALNEKKYDEWTAMGKSVGETWSLRAGVAIGVDYYVLPALYVGFAVQPFAYSYNMSNFKPQEGLASLKADSHTYSILASPTLKIGFKF